MDVRCSLVTPLVVEPGRAVVTDRRLYFQKLYNVGRGKGLLSHPLGAVLGWARRVFGTSENAVEVRRAAGRPLSSLHPFALSLLAR